LTRSEEGRVVAGLAELFAFVELFSSVIVWREFENLQIRKGDRK
jgi:hypothetical protein